MIVDPDATARTSTGTDAGDVELLTTRQVAQFVAKGFLAFDSVVPADTNEAALEHFAEHGMVDMLRDKPDSGTPFSEIYPDPSPIGAMLRLPRVKGIIASLVGSNPNFDHDWVHVRSGGDVVDQHLHQDAIIDTTLAFDIQIFWFPHAISPGGGGTGFVPGSHLRVVNEMDIARYQNVVGQRDVTCPAGSIIVFHQGMWHRGRANRGTENRWAYKIRLNPTEPQVRNWDLTDFAEVQGQPHDHIFANYDSDTAAGGFRAAEPWFEAAAGRLETAKRSRLWRYLTGDDAFDSDWYLTRTERRADIDRVVVREATGASDETVVADETVCARRDSGARSGGPVSVRQNVLFLWLATSALDSAVIAWARYDGTSVGPTPPSEDKAKAPYTNGVDALRDGWRLIQASQLQAPIPGAEREVSYLRHEFIFEQLVDS